MKIKSDPYLHENAFYLSCEPRRLGKLIAHYHLYSQILALPGAFLELGIFKGASFMRFLKIRQLLEPKSNRPFVGFDIFGEFPETDHPGDKEMRRAFVSNAGSTSVSVIELKKLIEDQGLSSGVELCPGDICKTLPDFIERENSPALALVNLDVDIYEPCKVAINTCWPLLVPGGILVLDDYDFFPGTNELADELAAREGLQIQRTPLAPSPCWIQKPFR